MRRLTIQFPNQLAMNGSNLPQMQNIQNGRTQAAMNAMLEKQQLLQKQALQQRQQGKMGPSPSPQQQQQAQMGNMNNASSPSIANNAAAAMGRSPAMGARMQQVGSQQGPGMQGGQVNGVSQQQIQQQMQLQQTQGQPQQQQQQLPVAGQAQNDARKLFEMMEEMLDNPHGNWPPEQLRLVRCFPWITCSIFQIGLGFRVEFP